MLGAINSLVALIAVKDAHQGTCLHICMHCSLSVYPSVWLRADKLVPDFFETVPSSYKLTVSLFWQYQSGLGNEYDTLILNWQVYGRYALDFGAIRGFEFSKNRRVRNLCSPSDNGIK